MRARLQVRPYSWTTSIPLSDMREIRATSELIAKNIRRLIALLS
jgi:hypothetical protein